MNSNLNPRKSGREPALGTGASPNLTGMEPSLGSKPLLQSDYQIALAGVQSRLGNRESVRRLIATLRDGDSHQRIQTARVLASINTLEALEAVTSLANDPDYRVRAACANALGRRGSQEGLAILTGLIQDNDREVRESAVRAMTNVALKHEENPQLIRRVVRELGDRLHDTSPQVQQVATVMLGWIGGADAATTLNRARASSNPKVRDSAEVVSKWNNTSDAIGSYRKKYRNPIPAGWVVARQLLPGVNWFTHLSPMVIFIPALVVSIWKDGPITIPMWVNLLLMMFPILTPIGSFIFAWVNTSHYREQQAMQILKLAPLPKTVMQWGYILASLYRLRIPILVAWAATFQDYGRQEAGIHDPLTWFLSSLFISRTIYLAFVGTSASIQPRDGTSFYNAMLVAIVFCYVAWWFAYVYLIALGQTYWMIGITIVEFVILAVGLYRTRNNA